MLAMLLRLLSELDADSSERLRERVMELTLPYAQPDGSVSVPVGAYLAVAQKSIPVGSCDAS